MNNLPHWPRRLRAALAAAYVGLSETKFRLEVAAGRLPAPEHDGGNRLWYREELDAALDRRRGGVARSGRDIVRERLHHEGPVEAR